MESIIEEAVPRSLPEMARLHHTSFDEGWDEANLASLLAMTGSIALVERESIESPVRGFILLRAVLDEAEIITIVVDPMLRGRNIGKNLLLAGLKAALEMGALSLFLEVAVDNVAALALYEGFGFCVVGQRKAYYRRGSSHVDAVMMRLDLQAAP